MRRYLAAPHSNDHPMKNKAAWWQNGWRRAKDIHGGWTANRTGQNRAFRARNRWERAATQVNDLEDTKTK